MTTIWPYIGLLTMIGVLLIILGLTIILILGLLEETLLKRSKYLPAAVVSTLSVVLAMALFAAVTVLAVDQSDGRLQSGIAVTLVGLIMLASGIRGSVQASDAFWTPGFRLAQVFGAIGVYIVIAVVQPEWLRLVAIPLLGFVGWLFDLPLLGWVVRFVGGLFVLWSLGELVRFATVAFSMPLALSAREKD